MSLPAPVSYHDERPFANLLASRSKHQRYHDKMHACEETACGKAFATQKDLKRHKMTHDKLGSSAGSKAGGAASGYRCNVSGCVKARSGHVYNRKDNFDRHMHSKHPDLDYEASNYWVG